MDERIDDHIEAEGMANDDYFLITVEKGTVIHATRDFKVLSLKEALEQKKIENLQKYLPLIFKRADGESLPKPI